MINIQRFLSLLVSTLSLLLATSLAAQPICDRQCLINLADDYLDALVAHDPNMVALAKDIQTIENLKPIKPGQGLWNIASTTPDKFKILVPDPVSQQIGFIVVMHEKTENNIEVPIQVAFRLQIKDGEITEAEHLINHEVEDANIENLTTPRLPLKTSVPMAYKDSRGRLLSIGKSYYDALVSSNGSLAPFADDCVRHENGYQSSRNAIPADPMNDFSIFASMGCAAQLNTQLYSYIDSIDFRRVEIADEETGLVFGLSHFRQAMDKPVYQTVGVPGHEVLTDERDAYDLSAIHIFKIWSGQIHEVEAVGYFTEYMSSNGWD